MSSNFNNTRDGSLAGEFVVDTDLFTDCILIFTIHRVDLWREDQLLMLIRSLRL